MRRAQYHLEMWVADLRDLCNRRPWGIIWVALLLASCYFPISVLEYAAGRTSRAVRLVVLATGGCFVVLVALLETRLMARERHKE